MAVELLTFILFSMNRVIEFIIVELKGYHVISLTRDIPPDLDYIDTKDFDLTTKQLLRFKNGYLTEIKRLQGKIWQINLKLEEPQTKAEFKRERKEQIRKDEERKREYKRERDKIFNDLFGRFSEFLNGNKRYNQ